MECIGQDSRSANARQGSKMATVQPPLPTSYRATNMALEREVKDLLNGGYGLYNMDIHEAGTQA